MAADAISRNKSIIIGARVPFSTASVLPALLGGVWGWVYAGQQFNWLHASIAVLGVLFLHLGANTINDYYDWEMSDKINRFPTPFSGGSRSRLEKVLPRKSFLHMSISFFILAFLSAGVLMYLDRVLVLVVGTAGALCGFLYSARPVSLQSRGLGELAIFLAFGPLITLGMGYAACGIWEPEFLLIGIPNGFIVANILWINEFPDFEADNKSGKRTLVVRLGTSRARYGYVALFGLFYLSVILLCIIGVYPPWSLAVLLTVPLVAKHARHMWKNHANPLTIVPAQAGTIQLQILTAVLVIISFIVDKYV